MVNHIFRFPLNNNNDAIIAHRCHLLINFLRSFCKDCWLRAGVNFCSSLCYSETEKASHGRHSVSVG